MRNNEEERLQASVREFLTYCLPLDDSPDYVEWCASLSGIRLSQGMRRKAKGQGLRKGWPDLSFILPDGSIRLIELKATKGVLSLEQKRIRGMVPADRWACCRSLDEVEATLRGWGVKLRSHPFALI